MLNPNTLRPHYSAFLSPKGLKEPRILLTGHSHQAWPDAAEQGLIAAFEDAALHIDDKWGAAFQKARDIQNYLAENIAGTLANEFALGQSSHELVSRFLSALNLKQRPRIVSTQGEFHSMHRQLSRLAEAGVEISLLPIHPIESLSERLAGSLTESTAAVMVSSVLFESSSRVGSLRELALRAEQLGIPMLVDAYHAFGVLPFSLAELGGPSVFITAGGYKYAQWGEGCCFLRVPSGCTLRPIYTGWFSDFSSLDAPREGSAEVRYGSTPAARFAGSTYDPTSHYRASAVIDFFRTQKLEIAALRQLSLRQTGRLIEHFSSAGPAAGELLTPASPELRGGFVALRHPKASQLKAQLHARGIHTDCRGEIIRFGPAPYILDEELDAAAQIYLELAAETIN